MHGKCIITCILINKGGRRSFHEDGTSGCREARKMAGLLSGEQDKLRGRFAMEETLAIILENLPQPNKSGK